VLGQEGWAFNVHVQEFISSETMQWGLGSRNPLFTNNSVHEQIFQAKNVSDDERFLGLRTRKLATAAS
jgi:hypothetical protein